MTQHKTSKIRFASVTGSVLLFLLAANPLRTFAVPPPSTASCPTDPKTGKLAECCDGIDNDGDGQIDFYPKGDTPADPKCLYNEDTEHDTPTQSTIIPCVDKCTTESVFLLINNIIKFFFKTILIPLIVIMIMYTGFSYITAGGNTAKKIKLLGLLKHIVLGIVLILTAWLIVKIILGGLGVDAGIQFLK